MIDTQEEKRGISIQGGTFSSMKPGLEKSQVKRALICVVGCPWADIHVVISFLSSRPDLE